MGHINKSRHVSTSTLIEHTAAANYLAFFKCHCMHFTLQSLQRSTPTQKLQSKCKVSDFSKGQELGLL